MICTACFALPPTFTTPAKNPQAQSQAAGGAPVWQYTAAVAALDQTPGQMLGTVQSVRLTVSTNGSIDQISFYWAFCDGGNLKITLYDNSDNLLSVGAAVGFPGDGLGRDMTVTLPAAVSVTAGQNIFVACIPDNANSTLSYALAGGTRKYKSGTTYGAQFVDPFVAEGSDSILFRAGIHIVP